MDVPIGVPQGSILGPLLFILLVNDLPHCLKSCNVVLYADDTVIYYSSSMISDVESKLNADLANITDWFNSNRLTLNFEKSNFLLLGSSRKLKSCGTIELIVQEKKIIQSSTVKYLGIIIHENLTWSDHIKILSSKINKCIGILKRVRHLLPQKELVRLYNTIILPLFDYGDIVWADKSNKCLMDDLQILQNKAAKVILGLPRATSSTEALETLHWAKLYLRREKHRRAAVF